MLLWGDLHNHCGITYGFGSLSNALKIARSHLDFCCITGHAMWPDIYERTPETAFIVDFHHEGFKKLSDHWDEIRQEISRQNDGGLVTFQSYEIHSSRYGDHHIISPDDRLPLIYRDSPGELVADCGVPAIAVPHHIGYTPGYRGINWDLYDQDISPCVEVYSKHGCAMSETAPYPYYHDMGPRDSHNTVYQGLRQGKRFAFLASTDHHAGFPGSYGDGLTAVLAREKSREAIWEALLAGRAYAVTGDRIECDFTINGHGLGETVHAAGRKLRCAVKGEYWADKMVLYKNCEPLAVLCGEQLGRRPLSACKLRVEMGWGNSEELTRWNGEIRTDGRIAGANLYLRGRSLLSPTGHDGRPVEVNDIDNRVLETNEHSFAWQCETVRNKSTLHPQTNAVVVEIEGGPDTVVEISVNGHTHRASLAQLLESGVSWHVKPWHSEAVKIHAAIPDSSYEMVLEAEDEGSGEMDVYHAEFVQKNGQWAFISPIYAGI
ncbi:MAG: hypothetical protein QM296_03170 [Bacillota bacterium]|nr:hypothetical protein [Bacillota bacterium]